MPQKSANHWLKHTILLIIRNGKRSFWQMVPFVISGIVFLNATVLALQKNTPPYISVYLLITVFMLFMVIVVIYFRELRLEFESLQYAYLSGYNMVYLALIVFSKWLLITLTGTTIALVYIIVKGNLSSQDFGAPFLFLFREFFFLTSFFIVGLMFITVYYTLKQWKIQ